MKLLTLKSKPIYETSSNISPIFIRMKEYGIRPTKLVEKNIQKGTPTTAELAFKNQLGTIGVSRRNKK